jgi:hypothetical protein
MDGQPSSVVPKPMRGGTELACGRGTEGLEGQHLAGVTPGEDRPRGSPGNTDPPERIRRMLTSLEPRESADASSFGAEREQAQERHEGEVQS